MFFLPFTLRLQVEALLASEDYGKDLASVNNLLKKHQLLEADISAHEVTLLTHSFPDFPRHILFYSPTVLMNPCSSSVHRYTCSKCTHIVIFILLLEL